MVYYRKYRPQKIAELDSEEIRQKLYSAFYDLSNTSHAFLFTGPKGLGKTSTARIVAKVVNCERRNVILSKAKDLKNKKDSSAKPQNDIQKSIEPCNECSQCKSITNGTNLDILEIDGASNRGIDEIRDLREKIRLSPVSATKKVYIIDEVHMLTNEAFNALLKTLEEPPQHVIFILCTTEPHKVPDTIISRCFHISFQLATKEELLSSFKRIKESEKLKIEDGVLEYIAELSDGSFRDGAKILEEMASLVSADGNKITKELVEEKFQISNIKYQISKMLEYLEKKNIKEALKLVSELVEQGVDIKFFIEKMVGELHSILLFQVGVKDSKLDPSAQRINFQISDLKNLIELFTKAYGELKYAVLPSIPLEIAVIEWGLKTQNQTEQNTEPNGKEIPSSSVSKIPGSSVSDIKGKQDSDGIWKQFIDQVKIHNYSLAGILRGCSLKSHNDKEFIIETAYKFHKEKLSDKKAMEVLEKVISEIAGKSAKISIILKEK